MKQRFLAWPGWPLLRFAWLLSAANAVWFSFVYGGSDWLTAHRSLRVPIHLPIELSIPLIPGAVVAYMSIYLLFLAVPFVLRTRPEIEMLARQQAIVIAVAGAVFLLLPADLAYAPPTNLGAWGPLFRFADWLNLDHNLVPSLHVALSAMCLEHFATRATTGGKWLLRSWGLLIAASTLLTHQHHVLDVFAGYALALGVVWRSRRANLRCLS